MLINGLIFFQCSQYSVDKAKIVLLTSSLYLGSEMAAQARFVERRVYYSGDIVFREGEPGECAYIVQEGLIEIFKDDNGQKAVLGTVGKGSIFGEMALIDNSPRMATARAAKQSTVMIVTSAVFHAKLKKADPFVRGLLNIFAKNIRAMGKQIRAQEE